MSSVRVRLANETDLPELVAMIKEMAASEDDQPIVTATEVGLRLHLFGDAPAAEVLVAEIAETVAGYALFSMTFSPYLGSPSLFVKNLFVRTSSRGQGVGKVLLVHLAQYAIERECMRIEWDVLPENSDASAFYEALGIRAIESRPYYRLSAEAIFELARTGAVSTAARRN